VVVDLRPQQHRATLMLFTGSGLVAFGIWGATRPDLFEGRALPIMAGVAGIFFAVVAVALRLAPRGVDSIELDGGRLVLVEKQNRIALGLSLVHGVLVVDEPLGRGHPLLCLATRGGSLIEVALLREEYIEQVAAALREDLDVGGDELPPCPETPVTLTEDALVTDGERFPLDTLRAVDFVDHLSVHGPGLVLHAGEAETLEPLPTEEHASCDAATLMRRIAAGTHVPLPGLTRSAGVSLALHIDRARTMMQM
jgi:hypothetical protein